jgi:hypothetical protein
MKSACLCLMLCVCGTALGSDYGGGWGAGSPSDPWNAEAIPSGLRFGGPATVSVQTGATVDGDGYGDSNGNGAQFGGPGPCLGCGTCTHWATRPWYAHWGPDGIGNVSGHHKHHWRQRCICAPCD